MIRAVTIGSILISIIPFFLVLPNFPRSAFIIDWLVLIIAMGGVRIIFKITAERLRNPGKGDKKNVLIVGANDTGELLVREFVKQPELGYKPVAFLDNNPDKWGIRIHGVKVMGKISQLSQVVKVRKVDEIIIALSQPSGDEVKDLVSRARWLSASQN